MIQLSLRLLRIVPAVLIALSFAHAEAADYGPSPATLWLIVDRYGSTQVHLRLLDRPANARSFTAALERLIEGRITSVVADSTSPVWAAYGVCSAGMARDGALFSGTVDLRTLMAALREDGHASRLEVILQLPRAPMMSQLPAGALPKRHIESGLWFDLPLDAAVPPWRLEVGFTRERVAWAVGLPLAILVASIAWLGWLRLAADRAAQRDAARVWFGYARGTRWTVLGTWIAWCSAVHALGTSRLVELQIGEVPWLVGGVAIAALYLIPPSLIALLASSWTHGIMVRIRGVEWSHAEAMTHGGMQLGALILFFGGVVIALRAPSLGFIVGILAVSIAGSLVLVMRARRMQGISLHALSTGELRDRVFQLAQSAGVKIGQVYLLPMARIRIANAFAVQGETVMLTDYLLRHLSRREVDAIVAHEITHLKKGHPRAIGLMLAGAGGIGVFGGSVSTGGASWLALGGGLLLWMLAFLVMSRRFERIADAGSAALTGDAEAMISALAKLNRLNHMPVEWGRWDESLLTHPSTARRARAIGKAAGIAPERIAELLRAEPTAEVHYAIPAVGGNEGKLFSTVYKSSSASRISLVMMAIGILTPIGIVHLARLVAGPPATYRVLGLLGLFATPILVLAVIDRMAVAPLRPLARKLRDRLAPQGLDPGPASTFVGFSPGPLPRVYEGFFDWDVGHLFQAGDRIVYAGEETRFALRRDQVLAIESVPGAPGWIPIRRIRITWQATPGETPKAFLLRPADVRSLSRSNRAARSLEQRLETWWKGSPSTGPAAATMGPPALGEVTSVSPRAVAGKRQSVVGLSVVFCLSFLIAAALVGYQSGFGLLYTVGVAVLTQAFLLIPYWRYRDPAPPQYAATVEPVPSHSSAPAA